MPWVSRLHHDAARTVGAPRSAGNLMQQLERSLPGTEVGALKPHVAVHHTDGGGVSDHVFALCHLLGFRFAPRPEPSFS